MELLFKRRQDMKPIGGATLKLWAKVELSEDEQLALRKYNLTNQRMITVIQPTLMRNTAFIGIGVFAMTLAAASFTWNTQIGFVLALVLGVVLSFIYFTQKRETIIVRDLLHGRNFSCGSVVELARKEVWVEDAAFVLQQVIASSKHWHGTQRFTIDELPKDEARKVILRGL